jgi:hypothetical protein
MKIRAAMIGMMGPMALLLATLTAIEKASSGGSTSGRAADGSKHRDRWLIEHGDRLEPQHAPAPSLDKPIFILPPKDKLRPIPNRQSRS